MTADDLMKLFAERFEVSAVLAPRLRAIAEAVIEIAAEAASTEREACAMIADGELMEIGDAGEERIVKAIAAAIRARGKP